MKHSHPVAHQWLLGCLGGLTKSSITFALAFLTFQCDYPISNHGDIRPPADIPAVVLVYCMGKCHC